jgi:hypothetical protein
MVPLDDYPRLRPPRRKEKVAIAIVAAAMLVLFAVAYRIAANGPASPPAGTRLVP